MRLAWETVHQPIHPSWDAVGAREARIGTTVEAE
jgi:hypothetical protein